MVSSYAENKIRLALQLDVPYLSRLGSGVETSSFLKKVIPSAVLVLFAQGHSEDFSLLYIQRAVDGGAHSGQMAFPGGKFELSDQGNPVLTALREAQEEVGIDPKAVQVLGKLPSLVTPTGFSIEPIVGIHHQGREEILIHADPNEVAQAVWIPFSTLLDAQTYKQEVIEVGPTRHVIDVLQINSFRIWGATGSISKNLIDRWNQV